MMDTDGNRLMGSIVEVNEATVTMDFNHPLAGETMHFEGVVQEVRDATPEEIAALMTNDGCGDCDCGHDHDHEHGHHHHGGGGCGGCGC